MANAVLIIITILILGFIWMTWLRHGLMSILEQVEQKQQVLQKDLAQRRNTVPYLLESIRAEEEPDEAWRKLLEERAVFHGATSLEKEWEFERALLHFVRDKSLKSINFLEAKKDILDLTQLIEAKKREMDIALAAYNEKKKQFPYSLASAIFGLRSV